MLLGEVFDCMTQLLLYAIYIILSVLVLMYLVFKNCKPISEKWFSFVYGSYIAPGLQPGLNPFQERFFKDLDKIVSKDPELRKKNLFRMLEIGVGQGANLQYYPKNCRLICLEPNDGFQQYYEKNKTKHPNLVVEKCITGKAEDMKDIPDEYVDVVVSTFVLCSVTNVDAVLREVKRVLCKGGQFLVWDHVASPDNTIHNKLQKLMYPLWKVYFNGCHLLRTQEHQLKAAGFSKLELEKVYIPKILYFVRYTLMGKAVK